MTLNNTNELALLLEEAKSGLDDKEGDHSK